MSCSNPESLGRLIYLTAQEIKNFAEKLLKPHGLTLEQFHLLKQMSLESGMSQRELGELANKTPANITRILDRLELKNLITRNSSKKDRRTTYVFLTNKGNALVQQVFAKFESFSSQLKEGVSDKDQQVTRKVLDTIDKNLQIMSQEM